MQTAPLLEWPGVATELVSFVGLFLALGAVGFRYAVARPSLAAPARAEHRVYASALRRAAALGLAGALVTTALLVRRLPEQAARKHLAVPAFLATTPLSAAQAGLLAIAVLGLALAAVGGRGARAGWLLALVGLVAGTLRAAFFGQWGRLVNPMHTLAGGLWIGTLFMLAAAGLPAAWRERGRRDQLVAEMVRAFSPLALASGGTLVVFGVVTAWRHLPTVSALWTTPYGWALVAKLAVVAVVFALGALNWRRVGPALGTERATGTFRRSATAELAAAGVVLVLSAVLVSLPSPKRPPAGPPGTPGTPGAPATTQPVTTRLAPAPPTAALPAVRPTS